MGRKKGELATAQDVRRLEAASEAARQAGERLRAVRVAGKPAGPARGKGPGGRTFAVVTGLRRVEGGVELVVRCCGKHPGRMFRDKPTSVLVSWGWCADEVVPDGPARTGPPPRWKCSVCGRGDGVGRCCTLGNRLPANAAARLEYERTGAL